MALASLFSRGGAAFDSVVMFWLVMLQGINFAECVRCLHCKDNIAPGHDADASPLVVVVAANVVAITAAAGTVAGLTLPWHKRRIPKEAKLDAQFLAGMLRLNLGCGYFSYDQFGTAPMVLSDASRSAAYSGGGYVNADGYYQYWRNGTRAARQPIDYLEGDTWRVAPPARRNSLHLLRRASVSHKRSNFEGLDNVR